MEGVARGRRARAPEAAARERGGRRLHLRPHALAGAARRPRARARARNALSRSSRDGRSARARARAAVRQSGRRDQRLSPDRAVGVACPPSARALCEARRGSRPQGFPEFALDRRARGRHGHAFARIAKSRCARRVGGHRALPRIAPCGSPCAVAIRGRGPTHRRAARSPGEGPGLRGRDGHVGVRRRRRRGSAGPGLRRGGHVRGRRPRDRATPRSAGPACRSRGPRRAHQVGGPTQAGADCARGATRHFACAAARRRDRARGPRRCATTRRSSFPILPASARRCGSSDVRGAFHARRPRARARRFLWACWKAWRWPVRDILRSRSRPARVARRGASRLRAAARSRMRGARSRRTSSACR